MRAAGDSDLNIYGIFGYPLGHTISPAIQNRALDHYGLKSIYFAFECPPRRFRFLMRNLKSLVLSGFNVTVPYKGIVLRYLNSNNLSAEAKAIGAVNTVWRKGSKWFGTNTDVSGFLTSLRKEGKFNPRGKKVLILGAGGSARAVAYGLAQSGARQIWFASRRKSPRQKIIREFKPLFSKTSFDGLFLKDKKKLQKVIDDVFLIVNATSVGVLFASTQLIPSSLIPKSRKGKQKLFFDLVYHKPTPFLINAERKGHRVLDGKGMLVYQGARAFEIWTGKRAPVREMKKALDHALVSH